MTEYHIEFKLAKYRQADGFVYIYTAKEKEKVDIDKLIQEATDRCSKLFKTPVKYVKHTVK